jgi:hypothetical protein
MQFVNGKTLGSFVAGATPLVLNIAQAFGAGMTDAQVTAVVALAFFLAAMLGTAGHNDALNTMPPWNQAKPVEIDGNTALVVPATPVLPVAGVLDLSLTTTTPPVTEGELK